MEPLSRRRPTQAITSLRPLATALLLLLVLLDEEATEAAAARRASQSAQSPGMWFGPRLGRRPKRNLSPDQLARLVDMMEDAPWVLLAANGNELLTEGKRHTVNFTPRLGRESAEDAAGVLPPDRWLTAAVVGDSAADLMSQRSPPFAPRLGRARYL